MGQATSLSQPAPRWAVWHWKLHWQITLGMVIGVILGLLSGSQAIASGGAATREALLGRWDFQIYGLIGDLFLNGLKMIVVPIVFSSLIIAVCGIGGQAGFARMGLKTLAFYLGTSFVAIMIGLVLVNLIKPGIVTPGQPVLNIQNTAMFQAETDNLAERTAGRGAADFLDTIRELVPPNLIAAAAEGQLLGLIVAAMLIGFFLTRMEGRPREVLQAFWQGIYDLTLMITDLILRFAPIGVAALLARTLADSYATLTVDDRLGEFLQIIAKFFFTILAGLSIHMFIVLPIILLVFARVSPLQHFKALAPALMTAFSTASSAAALPVSMDCAETRAGVPRRVTSFVLPFGATVNMDGTALYECAAAMFIAQTYGIELGFTQQIFIVFVALMTSLGVAAVPAASLVAIVIILRSSGVPIEGLALILVVDRPLDMCRTTVNVFSDTVATRIIHRGEMAHERRLAAESS